MLFACDAAVLSCVFSLSPARDTVGSVERDKAEINRMRSKTNWNSEPVKLDRFVSAPANETKYVYTVSTLL